MGPGVDHIVYATPDLDGGIREIAARLSAEVTPGGEHPGIGTRNALVSLGPAAYLEIIGPDPAQPDTSRPRPFGIDRLSTPRLVTWAARAADLEHQVEQARSRAVDLGTILPMSRRRPDGVVLSWRLTYPDVLRGGGIVPFLIDWGASRHPASDLPASCRLLELRAVHPRPETVIEMLDALGVTLRVDAGPEPGLTAVVETPKGRIELR